MTDLNSFYATWSPRILSIFRIVFGLLFMLHGTQKLLNYPPGPAEMGFPFPLFTLPGIAGALELVAHPVGTLHAPCCIHCVWRDGCRLLYGTL